MAEDTMDIYNPNATDKEKAWFNAFRRYLVPILGVGEAIASQGQSPGTAAMNVERNFQLQEDRRRQMLKEEEDRKAAALERAYKQAQREREKAAQESVSLAQDLMNDSVVYPEETGSFIPGTVTEEKNIGERAYTGEPTPAEQKSKEILDQFNAAVGRSLGKTEEPITPDTKPEFSDESITAPTQVKPVPTAQPLKGVTQKGLSALDALIKSWAIKYPDQEATKNFITSIEKTQSLGKQSGEMERLNNFQQMLKNSDLNDDEKLKIVQDFVASESPVDYLNYLYKKDQPDFFTRLIAAQNVKENSPSEKFGSLDEKIRNDPVVLKQSQVFSAAEDLKRLLTSNNPIGAEAFGTKMAKLSGEVGNLAIQEQMQYKGSQAAWSRFKQAIQKLKSGTLTEENKRYALEIVSMYLNTASNVRNERLRAIMNSHAYEKNIPVKDLYPIAESYGWSAPVTNYISPEKIRLAREAINDPNASDAVKAKAKSILDESGQ